ncbi:unnamed protein product, partial [Rhizoctonia solani]
SMGAVPICNIVGALVKSPDLVRRPRTSRRALAVSGPSPQPKRGITPGESAPSTPSEPAHIPPPIMGSVTVIRSADQVAGRDLKPLRPTTTPFKTTSSIPSHLPLNPSPLSFELASSEDPAPKISLFANIRPASTANRIRVGANIRARKRTEQNEPGVEDIPVTERKIQGLGCQYVCSARLSCVC